MATRNERREHARELAREQREAQQRRRRRNRWLLNGGIGAGLLAIVAVVALVVTTGGAAASMIPGNVAHDAVTVTAEGATPTTVADADAAPTAGADDPGTVDIVVFADYLCPFCGQFETANAEQIDQWVASGTASLEFHPIAILDRLSLGTAYSTRAANAMACVADARPDAVTAFNELLFANQPAEQTEGLTDSQLAAFAERAGAGDVSACIDARDWADWVGEATERALAGQTSPDGAAIDSTPTVFVDGQEYTAWLSANSRALADPTAFADFVAEVGDVPVS